MYTFFYSEFYKFNQNIYYNLLQQEDSLQNAMLKGVHASSKLTLSPIVCILSIIEGVALEALLVINSLYTNQFYLSDHLESLYMRCIYYPAMTMLDSVDYLIYTLTSISLFKFYSI